ncbi:MAG: DUF1826 domain-containing protein [Pseudomonas sp.]|uniref:DUF1826 domain-containing protein n=1 Tax=Pseudomonas abieticivorans TaxID=2931382 RepID=UPI0020BF6CCF|nr:DUF1826 domain-containing protein [Pseudomonas sp. PIA16]MDE1168854.1 DUF1826 domain-containing protein [Pseudomonas sp.]
MLALNTSRPAPRQVFGEAPDVMTQVLLESVNLAVWQRRLPAHIEDFGALVLALGEPLAHTLYLDLADPQAPVDLTGLASGLRDLQGYEGFLADVTWLVEAYACLLGARRVGLRLRVLDKAMCPRFHVDHVPVRLLTTYAGVGSQWLEEGTMRRAQLGNPAAEPTAPEQVRNLMCGDVALLKGEKWQGNEGAGLIHRSPATQGARRLILSLDWLA